MWLHVQTFKIHNKSNLKVFVLHWSQVPKTLHKQMLVICIYVREDKKSEKEKEISKSLHFLWVLSIYTENEENVLLSNDNKASNIVPFFFVSN